MQGKKTKIALVGYKLSSGGLERVFSSVSELLQNANFDIHVVVLENEIEYSYGGTLINLGNYSKFQKYFKLKQHLKDNHFDYVIDFRHRINPWMEMLFIYYLYAGFKFIYTIHSSKLEVYLTSKNWLSQKMLSKAYKIVPVSNALNEKIKKEFLFDKGIVIPNSIGLKATESDCLDQVLTYKYCIAVGRLVELKQFDKLIDAYCKSNLCNNGIHLVILGTGEEKERLEKQIQDSEMKSFIHLLGFKNNVFCYLKNAEFLVLSSKYEGFPMVVLEALYTGIPVVSFDCETGPRELVQNEFNGLLVENQNFKALEIAMNRFVADKELYYFCKENAKTSTALFSSGNCTNKWLDLLDNAKILELQTYKSR